MTPPAAPPCEAIPIGATERCGTPAVSSVAAACPNGHQGEPRPMCTGCLSLLLVVPISCFECHQNGRDHVRVNILTGRLDSGEQ